MLRRIVRVVAISLLVATSFVQTTHAAGTTLFGVVDVWPIAETIGLQPTESVDDPTGLTGRTDLGNGLTVVTVIKVQLTAVDAAGARLVGLTYWNPAYNKFKWYGVGGA